MLDRRHARALRDRPRHNRGIHIPLNNEIDQAGDPDRIAGLAHVRNQFEGPWVAWNVVRTLLSTAVVATLARASSCMDAAQPDDRGDAIPLA